MTFQELYRRLVKASVENRLEAEIQELTDYDPHQLNCLLHPEKCPPVFRLGDCECSDPEHCRVNCLFEALYRDEQGNLQIDPERCVGCGDCIDRCKARKLTDSKDILPALEAIHRAQRPVYAMIAPSFVNQYSGRVTPGKLRSAFKRLGFTGMVEVALFADILTLKEALEFDKNIQTQADFQLTSCCCPMWIAMIRKVYHQLIPHLPGAVSPMVACGRAIKQLHPGAITVFIGPCIAKKAEAREPDVADSTDFVLTFQEIQQVFEVAGIDPAQLPEDERDHSSRAGRIYAGTGGVSEAVEKTLQKINPNRSISLRAVQADGAVARKALLKDILAGNITANFYEGMGCVGGCVGGPKVLIPKEEGRRHVYEYGSQAAYETPIENPFVLELLHRLGFDTVESLLEHSDIFTRQF